MTIFEQLSALDPIVAQGNLHCLFQPILSLSEGRLYGFEALSRGPSNSTLHSPITLFAAARKACRLSELELLARETACRRFSEQALPGKLFLNVAPESLLETSHQPGRTLKLLEAFGIPADQVVIELTEQAPIEDFALLDAALRHYRAMGFRIALDDLGAGYSSLRLWSELRPDYVKIDRHFIDGIHLDPVKREFVGSILKMAKASRAQVIAEGIELAEELTVLADMGVDLVQGYLLGRPQARPSQERLLLPQPSPWRYDAALPSPPQVSTQIEMTASIATVLQIFHDQPELQALTILDPNHHPIGALHRDSLQMASSLSAA